ncbi:LIN41-like protein, partial [Mya arenaria]
MTSAGVDAQSFVPLPTVHVGTRKKSKLKINIDIEKRRRHKKGGAIFGRSFVSISGDLGRQTIVTDHTIHIAFPDESGVRTLNLVYNQAGHPPIPVNQRGGVYSLLTEKRHDLVHVADLPAEDAPLLFRELKEGKFDLIATVRPTHRQPGSPVKAADGKSETVSSTSGPEFQFTKPELELLRTWRTGEFYTYNHLTGQISLLREKRDGKQPTLAHAVDRLRVLPGADEWAFKSEESAGFYRKYLLQEEIETRLRPERAIRNPQSLPEVTGRQTLKRQWSFTSETGPIKDSFAVRALNGDVALRNLVTGSDVMERGKPFDADDALQEQNLKCPVCKNFYDTRDRNPHVLQCLHSTCRACLQSRVRAEMAQCPQCSEVNEVPNNDLQQLPVDHARQHLVKFFKVRNRSSEIGCDSCDPRNRATHRCKECDEFLCGACTEAHKRTKVTKGHNVLNVDSLKRLNLDEFHHKRTCTVPDHEDQHFSFYCYSKGCDQPICSLCAVTEHNKADGHDIRNINDVYLENKRVVESLLIDVKHKRGQAEEAIQSIEEEIQNLYIKESSTDEEIDQAFLACQKQLEKRKNELKEKLAATSKAKKKGMESQLDKLIGEKNALDHSARFSSNVLGYSDATEFLQMKDALFSRLGELKELEVDQRPHNKADIKFHGHKMIDAFQKFSNKMGEVWSTTAFIPNTKIQTYDIGLGREETAMMITLHDYERRPLAEPGVDIKVDVTNPMGKKARAHVIDLTDSEGAYKVIFQGVKLGDHRASVFIMGLPVIDPGVTFKVRRQTDLETDVLSLKFDDDDDDGVRPAKNRNRSYRVFGDIICPDFAFDPATCHPQNMVTADSRTLKNVRGRTANIGTALKNYRGALGTRAFGQAGRFYFERQLRNDLIFEVAIARKSEIDRNYTVDGSPYAWTVCARRCPLCRTVCLMTFHNGVRLYHLPLTENAPPGTTLRTTVGFLIDTKTKQWFIVDAKNRRLFYRFKNIDTSKPLWPVFGAYSTEYVSVSLALRTGKDVQAVPDIPSD